MLTVLLGRPPSQLSKLVRAFDLTHANPKGAQADFWMGTRDKFIVSRGRLVLEVKPRTGSDEGPEVQPIPGTGS